jgi:type IV secretory pathway TrbD component
VSLRRTPFHRVLHRPALLLGGERELVMMTAFAAGALGFAALNGVAAVIAAALWFGCLASLRRMAKADPQMSRVYVRQLRYRRYYPARSRPFRIG